MDWSGLSKREIEAELRYRMESTRARYAELQGARAEVEIAIRGAVGSDGSLCVHQARSIAREMLTALRAHKRAVKAFTEYTLHGRLTDED